MKKILILAGSARKGGNSDTLANAFGRGAQAMGHVVDKIYLGDQSIHGCIGCGFCDEHDGQCIHDDDAPAVVQAMVKADVIVLASPVYFHNVSAQLKLLIDRSYAQIARLKDKAFYFILSAADTEHHVSYRALESLLGYIECLPDATEAGHLLAGGIVSVGDAKDSDYMAQAMAMGRDV